MNQPDAMPDAEGESLTLRLGPALSEYLRRESAGRTIGPAELAERLLLRGIHQQRLDDATRDICPCADEGGPTVEALLAARLEAGAMLGAFAGWPAPSDCSSLVPNELAAAAARDMLERLRRQDRGR